MAIFAYNAKKPIHFVFAILQLTQFALVQSVLSNLLPQVPFQESALLRGPPAGGGQVPGRSIHDLPYGVMAYPLRDHRIFEWTLIYIVKSAEYLLYEVNSLEKGSIIKTFKGLEFSKSIQTPPHLVMKKNFFSWIIFKMLRITLIW